MDDDFSTKKKFRLDREEWNIRRSKKSYGFLTECRKHIITEKK